MAVYRPRRQVKLLPIAVVVAVVAVIIVIVVALLGPRLAPTSTDKFAAARASALEVANALDVFEIEYPKQTSSGAASALTHALNAFESSKPALAEIDSAHTSQIAADLSTLSDQVKAKAPADEVTTLAETIKQQLLAFSSGH